MEKRLLIAFVLSFAVLYGFRFLYPPAVPAPQPPAAKKAESGPAPAPSVAPAAPPAAPVGEVIHADVSQDRKIDTKIYEAIVSNVGGVLRSFRLKAYFDGQGKPIELIEPYAGGQVGYPLAIVTADATLDSQVAKGKFVFRDSTDPNHVELEFLENGVHVRKTIDFSPDKYVLTVSSSVQKNGVALPHQMALQGDIGDQSIPDVPAKQQVVYRTGTSFTHTPLPSVADPKDATASMAGVADQYFMAMFLLDKEAPIRVGKTDYKLANLPDGTEGAVVKAFHVLVPGGQAVQLYIGPKLEESMVAVNPSLGGVIDYGWFAPIARPCLIGLRWIYRYVGNYGWAIIILTCGLNLLLFPLRIKQQLSMQKMQKMAPQLKQLQDKYKKLKPGDPKRAEVEAELMEINKQQLSGCLPTLLQMPLLFAFLNMMNAAIELRGAPWILWIRDLSQEDHLFILPLLMGFAMFVQMKMSPTSPDPQQAKMMMITPILVTILFLWFRSASGLTLYWLTGNVIGIGQQWFIRNYWSDDAKRSRNRK